MHRMGNQVAHPVEHGAVPREARLAGEGLRHDDQRKVPTACRGTGVAGMLGAVVVDVDQRRRERCEALAERFGERGVQDRSSTR